MKLNHLLAALVGLSSAAGAEVPAPLIVDSFYGTRVYEGYVLSLNHHTLVFRANGWETEPSEILFRDDFEKRPWTVHVIHAQPHVYHDCDQLSSLYFFCRE